MLVCLMETLKQMVDIHNVIRLNGNRHSKKVASSRHTGVCRAAQEASVQHP